MSLRKSVEDFEKKDVRPRFFLDRIIWSKSLIDGSSERVVSRSWMNSLKPKKWYGQWDLNYPGFKSQLTLSLTQHGKILLVLAWHALHEAIEVERVHQSGFLLIRAGCP